MENEPKLKILYLKGLKLSSWCQILLNFTSMKGRNTPMPNAEHAGSVCYSPQEYNPVSEKLQSSKSRSTTSPFGVKNRTVHSFNPATEHFWHLLPRAKLVAHYNQTSFSAQGAGHAHIYVLPPPGSGEPLLQQCNVDNTLNRSTRDIHESWASNKHLLFCGSRKVFLFFPSMLTHGKEVCFRLAVCWGGWWNSQAYLLHGM